jgi:hypothetical protein
MSERERKAVESPLRHNSTTGEPQHDDAQHGEWTRQKLIRMDAEFRQRVERALRRGTEKNYSQRE